ncbi:hypothetical protein L3X39_11905 [Sabulilitoribacter multivorans]|uniref:GLPGLI family protein n=1 Tax=Flaviramulus multivorans TaxID=1304750 RepID=A0ABS9IL97_9FLAO|nr:hypothetical protein [Flaviramulus multivorans]MCF7561342.1 hypothetical protein [Flaviramulus multivorans]
MKNLKILLVLLTVLLLSSGHSFSQNCKAIDANRLALPVLRKQIATMEIVLNRTDSYIKLNNQTIKFDMGEHEVQGPARKWIYYVNDVQSIRGKNNLSYENGQFYLTIEFEGNESEIKGKCPGCMKGRRDKRAPDFNWKSPRIAKIRLKPIAYNGSIAFNVEKVDLIGKFEMGGKLDILIPMLNAIEIKLKNEIEKQTRKILNLPQNKAAMAKAFEGFVKMNRLERVSSVYTSGNKLFFCE